jgi:N-acyl-phosphatidylethanolamine-hydrolysing phospholipase D
VASKSSHHRDGSFHNNYIDFQPRGLAMLARWKFDAWRRGVPAAPSAPTPAIVPDLGFIQGNAKAGAQMLPSITWIGHATVLAQLAGLNVLTDPIFSQRASPLSFIGPQRAQKPGLLLHELPHIDVVLISHNHYDHLDAGTVKKLPDTIAWFVPLGLADWFRARGRERVVELDWWQSARHGRWTITCLPSQHWSRRIEQGVNESLWCAWLLDSGKRRYFFAGDTGYFDGFAEYGRRFGPIDLALLPIGAYEPRWFMRYQHLNPADAVAATHDLGARRMLGIHWGTFDLTDEPLDLPPQALAEAVSAAGADPERFRVLAIGETWHLPD